MMKFLLALTFVQIISKISCLPSTAFVVESYSKVRLQQPVMGLSVESQMPLDIMLNPILADEPPLGNKMESIFMKSDQIKNVESMNVDEKEIMESINKQTAPLNNANDEEASAILHDSDLIPTGNNQPAAFSIADPTPTTSTTTTPVSTLAS